MSRTHAVSETWRAKMQGARENAAPLPRCWAELEAVLWREGYGPVAAARIADWVATSHPDHLSRSGVNR